MHLSNDRPRALVALLAGVSLLVAAAISGSDVAPRAPSVSTELDEPTSCTVAYAADDSGAFGGNNEDFVNPLTSIWFVPGEGESYGTAYVGYDDFAIQGGVNEAGLFFDGLAVRQVEVPATPGRPEYTGPNLAVDLLTECDSVACVLERFKELGAPTTWIGQALFGDRFGDSVIIEPLAIIPKEGDFQVATNFFQSEIPPGERTDRRYVTATSMLAAAQTFSVDVMRDVMEATHQEGTDNTVYSTVYDLRAGVIHLYYFNDFASEVTFDLDEELAQGLHAYELSDLFPDNLIAGYVAAPIRNRLAAAIDALGPVAVSGNDVRDLAGTYEAESRTMAFQATDNGLEVREPWTPWVGLVALSPTEFARVTVDGAGVIHDQRLSFDLDGAQASVAIALDGSDPEVATRTEAPAPDSVDWRSLAILLTLAAGGALVWWALARRRGRQPGAIARRPILGEGPWRPH